MPEDVVAPGHSDELEPTGLDQAREVDEPHVRVVASRDSAEQLRGAHVQDGRPRSAWAGGLGSDPVDGYPKPTVAVALAARRVRQRRRRPEPWQAGVGRHRGGEGDALVAVAPAEDEVGVTTEDAALVMDLVADARVHCLRASMTAPTVTSGPRRPNGPTGSPLPSTCIADGKGVATRRARAGTGSSPLGRRTTECTALSEGGRATVGTGGRWAARVGQWSPPSREPSTSAVRVPTNRLAGSAEVVKASRSAVRYAPSCGRPPVTPIQDAPASVLR